MDMIVDLLRAIRSRYDDARKISAIQVSGRPGGDNFYVIHDPQLANWMDQTRSQMLEAFGEICREASLVVPSFPRQRLRH